MSLRRKFEAIDSNKDGFITRDELETFKQDALKSEFEAIVGRAVNLDEVFSMLDMNNDGKVSYAEFLAGASNKADLINEEQLRIAFDTMDLNRNGKVSVDELKWRFSSTNFAGSAELEGVDEDFWNRLIRNINSENDGTITFEEFKKEM